MGMFTQATFPLPLTSRGKRSPPRQDLHLEKSFGSWRPDQTAGTGRKHIHCRGPLSSQEGCGDLLLSPHHHAV